MHWKSDAFNSTKTNLRTTWRRSVFSFLKTAWPKNSRDFPVMATGVFISEQLSVLIFKKKMWCSSSKSKICVSTQRHMQVVVFITCTQFRQLRLLFDGIVVWSFDLMTGEAALQWDDHKTNDQLHPTCLVLKATGCAGQHTSKQFHIVVEIYSSHPSTNRLSCWQIARIQSRNDVSGLN